MFEEFNDYSNRQKPTFLNQGTEAHQTKTQNFSIFKISFIFKFVWEYDILWRTYLQQLHNWVDLSVFQPIISTKLESIAMVCSSWVHELFSVAVAAH